MKTIVIIALFGWFFLVQGFGRSTQSTGFSTVVGPFASLEDCEKIRKEATSGSEDNSGVKRSDSSWVMFRTTSCWSTSGFDNKGK